MAEALSRPPPFKKTTQVKRKKVIQGGARQKPRPSTRKINRVMKLKDLTETRLRKAVEFIAKVELQCLETNRNISREKIENTIMKNKGYTLKQCATIYQRYFKANAMKQIQITQGPPGFEIVRDSGGLGAVVSKVSNVSLQNMGLRPGAVLYKIDSIFLERRPHETVQSLFYDLQFPTTIIFRHRSNLVKLEEGHLYSPRTVEMRKDSMRTHMQTLMKGFHPQEVSNMSLSGISNMSGLSLTAQDITNARESDPSFKFHSRDMTQTSEDGDDDTSSDERYDFGNGALGTRQPKEYMATPPLAPHLHKQFLLTMIPEHQLHE